MRILMISRCPPYPLHLGDRLIVYHLARELSARGHELDLLALYDRESDAEADSKAQYAAFFRYVALFREQTRPPFSLLWRLVMPARRFPQRAPASWAAALWRALEARVAEEAYDVAHLFGGVQVYEFAPALGTLPAVITPYESYSLFLRRQAQVSRQSVLLRMMRRIARGYEQFMFTPYARVVVVSPQDRDELMALNPDLPVEVIPNGIDLGTFQAQTTPRDAATLLFTGNFEYPPNVDAALFLARQVLPAVCAQIPQARLYLVGHAPPAEVRALASARVIVTGRVDDVRPYLARATVFVCPLRYGAGIKNKVLEAMAMACPVVATPLSIDGIAARAGHDVLLVDTDTFAGGVVDALRNDGLRAALGSHGRSLVEAHYTWGGVATAYERVFEAARAGRVVS